MAFGTRSGIYRFKRWSYGIYSASNIFFEGSYFNYFDVQGSANSQDDFIVWAETLEEHDERLRKVVFKIRESGLKLNKTKCQIRKQSIIFLGHTISSESIPRSVNELQRFLDIVNYLRNFIPNRAIIPLHYVTPWKKSCGWITKVIYTPSKM